MQKNNKCSDWEENEFLSASVTMQRESEFSLTINLTLIPQHYNLTLFISS